MVNVEGVALPETRLSRAAPRLEPTNSRQWQDPLEDRRQTDQHHEQFEKACQTAILDELIDSPKANRTDDANNQDSDQGDKHRKPPCAGVVTALVEAISLTSADSLDRLDQVEPADFGRPNKSLAVAASASRYNIVITYEILVRTRGDHIDERKRFNQIAVEIADGDRGKRSRDRKSVV